MNLEDFPHSIRLPIRKVSAFTGSLFDDMEAIPFNYKSHYENSIPRMTTRDFYNHQRLWPTAHEDIYGSMRKHLSSDEKTVKAPKATANGSRKSFANQFIDHLKDSNYEKEFQKWETRAGTVLATTFTNWSWKKLAAIGASATTAGLAVGLYSSRKVNNDGEP